MLIVDYKVKVIHIETTFLYGELEEEICMEYLPGLKMNRNEMLILHKCINGLDQAARQIYKKVVAILKKL